MALFLNHQKGWLLYPARGEECASLTLVLYSELSLGYCLWGLVVDVLGLFGCGVFFQVIQCFSMSEWVSTTLEQAWKHLKMLSMEMRGKPQDFPG